MFNKIILFAANIQIKLVCLAFHFQYFVQFLVKKTLWQNYLYFKTPKLCVNMMGQRGSKKLSFYAVENS
jgi:hypothetical protein